jgi:zinc transport system substrate-binding protein
MAIRKPLLVASFFPLFDFARQIGGTNVEVRCLVPPGGDPHAAEPTPSSAQAVVQSDLVLLLGLGMDGWVEKLALAEGKARVATISQGLPLRHMGEAALAEFSKTSPDPGEIDPHVWLDPVLAQTLAHNIAGELVKLAPEHRVEIEAREAAFLGDLQKLDRDYSNACAQLPIRRVVTFHGAFGYLFSRYHLEMAGVIEEFPGNEPSAEYLRQLVDLMRKLKVKVIFAEPQLPDRPAQVIAREIGGRVERLDPCETILPDAPPMTYLERQRKNLETLRSALSTP